MIDLGILSLPQKLIGGALAALLALATVYGIHEHVAAGQWEARAAKNADLLSREQMGHAITRQSLATVEGELTRQSQMVVDLADEGARRTKAASDALSAAQAAGRAAEDRAAALDASAATVRPDAGKCAPSDTFWNQRGDL